MNLSVQGPHPQRRFGSTLYSCGHSAANRVQDSGYRAPPRPEAHVPSSCILHPVSSCHARDLSFPFRPATPFESATPGAERRPATPGAAAVRAQSVPGPGPAAVRRGGPVSGRRRRAGPAAGSGGGPFRGGAAVSAGAGPGTPGHMHFRLWRTERRLRANRFGIGEPRRRERARAAWALDAILVPLVGFDDRGHRLGMGAGSMTGRWPIWRAGPGAPCWWAWRSGSSACPGWRKPPGTGRWTG